MEVARRRLITGSVAFICEDSRSVHIGMHSESTLDTVLFFGTFLNTAAVCLASKPSSHFCSPYHHHHLAIAARGSCSPWLAYWLPRSPSDPFAKPNAHPLMILSSQCLLTLFSRNATASAVSPACCVASRGLKPKLRDHYRAHQLALWTWLIPQLQRVGRLEFLTLHDPEAEDVAAEDQLQELSVLHHLFSQYDDPDLYSGPVRPLQHMAGHYILPSTTSTPAPPTTTTPSLFSRLNTTPGFPRRSQPGRGKPPAFAPNTTAHAEATKPEGVDYVAYSTALSVTIAIGVSLLILNILIFAGAFTHISECPPAFADTPLAVEGGGHCVAVPPPNIPNGSATLGGSYPATPPDYQHHAQVVDYYGGTFYDGQDMTTRAPTHLARGRPHTPRSQHTCSSSSRTHRPTDAAAPVGDSSSTRGARS
ncbi:putative neuroligin-4, X-linked [Penaeus vannamei]|uniref:Putative neuroligin-4, X-linked n=1 Tax=Penaeus vannamei TaxID=6689 RepID=A0A423SW70_PENVA|nr:putative neuroligin-4, X-linked [Penaeus vannamei]